MKTANSSYESAVDGLRAVAILPVVLFHADLGCQGGYVGVDIFFVISGYLITGILIRGISDDSFSLSKFLGRRLRRLAPAVSVMTFFTSVASWWVFTPDDLREYGQSLVAYAVMLSNFYFFRESGYFAGANEFKPLLHTWSLSVEEQFYLFYPLLLGACRKWPARRRNILLAFLFTISFIASQSTVQNANAAAFYLLPFRAWELLAGALIYSCNLKLTTHSIWKELVGWAGLFLCLYPVFFFDDQTLFPGFSAMVPCLGACLILSCSDVTTSTVVCRILSTKALVAVGIISYSLYLWHWPLLVFARYLSVEELSLFTKLVIVFSSIAIAYPSVPT
ncbi:MAG: acyltransferase [bacterium]|nr:acyltransferase [bacterium]